MIKPLRKHLILFICLCLPLVAGCGGGDGGAPTRSVITITPDKVSVKSASTAVETLSQTLQILVKSSDSPNAHGIRDVNFSVLFEFTELPDQNIVPDTAGIVTLCDGTKIISTFFEEETNDVGVYNLCIAYKAGGGLQYAGNVKVLSGDKIQTSELKVESSDPLELEVLPSAQTITSPAAGTTVAYTVIGGNRPFTAFSSNPDMVQVAVSGNSLIAIISAVPDADTTVTITVIDTLGKSKTATLALDVPAASPLTILPSQQTLMSPVVGSTASFAVIGGMLPYRVFSGNPGLVQAVVSGSNIIAMVASIPLENTSVTLTVNDAEGTSALATLDLQVSTGQLAVYPTSQTVTNPSSGTTVAYLIRGGVAPYNTFVSHSNIVQATVEGSTMSVRVLSIPAADTDVTITVLDAAGQSYPVTLRLDVAEPTEPPPDVETPLTIIPGSATVVADTGGTVTFAITGGSGSYTTTSADPTKVCNSTDNDCDDSADTGIWFGATVRATVPVTVCPDMISLNVYDTEGHTDTATVNIISRVSTPLNVSLSSNTICENTVPCTGATVVETTLSISGGSSPYFVTSNNTSVIIDPGAGTTFTIFTINANNDSISADTTVILTVVDNCSDTKTVNVLVRNQNP